MFAVKRVTDEKGNLLIQDPPIAQFLFQNTKASVIWLVLRVWLAYTWFESGWRKFNDAAWMDGGQAILDYWTRAVAIPAPPARPLVTYGWYRDFLQFLIDSGSHPWFAKLIVFGELAIALGLFVGALVGIAAFFGALMNVSFLLAGTTSTNPVLLLAAIFLMLAWKNAGYLGIDRFLLPMLGTPWKQTRLQTTPAQAAPRAV
jgi:thiosulfate dehydrogenase (quinone) large subunit